MLNSKSSNQSDTPENDDSSDGFTEVHVGRSGVRRPVGIRVDSGLWEAFKRAVSANGLSTCEILEHVILGLTVGLTVKVHSSKTINVYAEIPKVVKRVRRYAREFEEVESEVGGRWVRFYDLDGGVWRKVKAEDELEVNEHGHLVGCGCLVCNPGGVVRR